MKFFIDLFIRPLLFIGVINSIISGRTKITFIFFVFIFSLDENEVVYINSVIIPEENVKMVTKEIHLDREVLYKGKVIAIEMNKTEIARYMGLRFFMFFADKTVIIIAISFSTFDLQNQCSIIT